MKRTKVYVQVQNKKTERWTNYKAAETFEAAVEMMNNLRQQYPTAKLRVLDPNLITHT